MPRERRQASEPTACLLNPVSSILPKGSWAGGSQGTLNSRVGDGRHLKVICSVSLFILMIRKVRPRITELPKAAQ